MQRFISVLLVVFTLVLGLSIINPAFAADLPESVQRQSRKDAMESETWKQFDKSGQVKFLQLETTAPASAASAGEKLDGSAGEVLIEIKVDPALKTESVEWTLANKGKSDIWVVAISKSETAVPLKLAPEGAATLTTVLVEGYCYIVVDNEGGKKAALDAKAKSGDVDAKTTDAKTMTVTWF
jgi:hypothetical protein